MAQFYIQDISTVSYTELHASLKRHHPVMGGRRDVQCHLFPKSPVTPALYFLTKDILDCELVSASHSLGAQGCTNPSSSPEEDQHLEGKSRKHQKLPFTKLPLIVKDPADSYSH